MSCPKCKDSGWIILQRNGIEAADRCPCFAMREIPAKPRTEDCHTAAERIVARTPWAPKSDPLLVKEITTWLGMRVKTERELEVFCIYVAENLAEWRGIAGLKSLLAEMRAHAAERLREHQEKEYQRRVVEWREELRQLGAAPTPVLISDRRANAMLHAAQIIDVDPAVAV